LDAGEAEKIEAAAKDAETAIASGDKEKIDAAAEALGKASQKLGEKMYADAQAAQAGADAAGGQAAGSEPGKKPEGDVVDAEFTEVKDTKK
jgi:molecular chaperone DnaK